MSITIFGPPGTGKTTTLLRIAEERLAAGIEPEDIGFMAFTRKAANEARDRACEKFKLHPDDLPFFRTLHSLAFRRLGLNNSQVMGPSDYISIARSLGLYITVRGVNEDGTFAGLTHGDRLLFMEQMSRAKLMPLKNYWEQFPNEDIQLAELDLMARTIAHYKKSREKLDFIDMIGRYCETDDNLDFDTLIVDEAQDLSPLQWAMVERLSKQARQTYYAGDDDQAIFTWAGADVSKFIAASPDKQILTQSYRCPHSVWSVARSIAIQIGERVPKDWGPAKREGAVEYVTDLDQVDMTKGTWLLLARNIFLLESLAEYCLHSGLVFSSILPSHVNYAQFTRPIMLWESLRKGRRAKAIEIRVVYDMMSAGGSVRHGSKALLERTPDNATMAMSDLKSNFGLCTDAIWHEAFDRMPAYVKEYLLAALRRGEKLLSEPRIRISTIHGAKGGEADNVLLLTDMAQRSYDEFHERPDSEHRVWYVAVTRARERLFIMRPKTSMFYDL